MSRFSATSLCTAAVLAGIFASPIAAQIIEIEGSEITMTERNLSIEAAQAAMDPLRLIEAYVVDKQAPRNERGGWGKRDSSTYVIGEQIDAVIYLANVGKHNPGQPDNPQEMELAIIIRDLDGNVIYQVDNVHTFKGVRRLQDPLQADYFRDRFTVSARVPLAGEYDVGFVFLDKTRAQDKQTPLEAAIRVVVEEPQGLPALTDLTEMMMAQGFDQSYLLRRCGAYFLSEVKIAGQDAFTETQFAVQDAMIRYFVNADAVIAAGFQDVPYDQALDEAFDGMDAIAQQYTARMLQNHQAGAHPWAEDIMLQRDAASCRVIYDQRERSE